MRSDKRHAAPEQGVKRALRPGGRFVADFGGQGNALSVRVALTAVLAQEGIDASVGNPWYVMRSCTSAATFLRSYAVIGQTLSNIGRAGKHMFGIAGTSRATQRTGSSSLRKVSKWRAACWFTGQLCCRPMSSGGWKHSARPS